MREGQLRGLISCLLWTSLVGGVQNLASSDPLHGTGHRFAKWIAKPVLSGLTAASHISGR